LTLKAVLGLSVREIARALLSRESTVAQRIVRAQRRIREGHFTFEVPSAEELPTRLASVLEVLYLTFNEGYAAHEGNALVRADLCQEALRLTVCLAACPATDLPAIHALAALMEFQTSRLPARLDADGELVRLAEQDRRLWDHQRIHRAFLHLDRSARGEQQTTYHLQAAIAAHHAAAPSASSTDWASILRLYDHLLALQPSPIVVLNRAVVLARLRGPKAGLEALKTLDDEPAVVDYHLLGATRGELLMQLGRRQEAAEAFRQALACRCSDPERRFLERRLQATAKTTRLRS
jgi:RNA polymerase sigma-70 factor (ECF subfamily)